MYVLSFLRFASRSVQQTEPRERVLAAQHIDVHERVLQRRNPRNHRCRALHALVSDSMCLSPRTETHPSLPLLSSAGWPILSWAKTHELVKAGTFKWVFCLLVRGSVDRGARLTSSSVYELKFGRSELVRADRFGRRKFVSLTFSNLEMRMI